MQDSTLEKIDFFPVLRQAAKFAASEDGAQKILSLRPFADEKKILAAKSLVFDCMNAIRLEKQGARRFPQISENFSVLRTNGKSLDVENLCDIADFCFCAASLRRDFSSDSENFPHLKKKIDEIPDFSSAEKIFIQSLDLKNRQIRETAEMRAANEKIRKIKSEIDAALHSFVHSEKFADVLQSSVPVLRSDRQVLAVKSSQKNRISGIVHEVSNSGQTVFLEPEKIVQKNNDLIQEEYALAVLKSRFLAELTDELRVFADDSELGEKIMAEIDAAFALARWGILNDAFIRDPKLEVKSPQKIVLLKARHPLLGESAVPIDIQFDDNVRALIISGPNTGGKTVAIKTAALLVALNQCGFPLPASDSSFLPIFDDIFVDIGDAQSLEMSLSTFSSRMKNLADATKKATSRSLVLLDELASGTDPEEGGALAMAALNYLLAKNATILATTHHGAVKNFAYENSACANACVEFDEKSLAPTFRIVAGAAGESHAIEIAENQNIPTEIVAQAKRFLSTEQADVSALIRGLNEKNRILSEKIDGADKKMAELNEKSARLAEKEFKLAQRSVEFNEKMQKKDSEFLQDARKKLENLVRVLREGEITKEKTKNVRAFLDDSQQILDKNRENLNREIENFAKMPKIFPKNNANRAKDNEKIEKMKKKLRNYAQNFKNENSVSLPPQKFEAGEEVLLRNNQRGRLLKREKGEKWLVEVGSLKIQILEKDLTLVAREQNAPQILLEKSDAKDFAQDKIFEKAGIRANKPAFELFVVGMRVESALKVVERQIDLAVVSGFSLFSIVHGKGEGILQTAIHNYLRTRAEVVDFKFASPEFGGTGKTEVRLCG